MSRNSLDLTDTRLLISARWAQREDLAVCLGNLMKNVRNNFSFIR